MFFLSFPFSHQTNEGNPAPVQDRLHPAGGTVALFSQMPSNTKPSHINRRRTIMVLFLEIKGYMSICSCRALLLLVLITCACSHVKLGGGPRGCARLKQAPNISTCSCRDKNRSHTFKKLICRATLTICCVLEARCMIKQVRRARTTWLTEE